MKLGIACVYYFPPGQEWILDLQLSRIARHTSQTDYKIYAAAERLGHDLKSRLAAEDRVQIVKLQAFQGVANKEHAFYLDRLIAHAFADGCTHVCTLDADSFPITDDWTEALATRMSKTGARFAAVHRIENLDAYLPHPSGYLMTREFFYAQSPMLYPGSGRYIPEMENFLRATGQRPDTGIGYGWRLWQTGEQWIPLLRSNRVNFHYLIAGVYGDTFFHLGATSRAPIFFRDAKRPLLRVSDQLKKLPVVWRLGRYLSGYHAQRVGRLAHEIRDVLRADPDRFIDVLRGIQAPDPAWALVEG